MDPPVRNENEVSRLSSTYRCLFCNLRLWLCGLVVWSLLLAPIVLAENEYRQPDGLVLVLNPVRGSGHDWFEDRAGYSVVRMPDRYEYALLGTSGGLKPSGLLVSSVDPRQSALPQKLRPTPEFLLQQRAAGPGGFAPPSAHPVDVQQPDGTVIKLTLRGGPPYSWYEDEWGYSVIQVPGRYEYALRGPDGKLVGSGIAAGSMSPEEAGFQRKIRPAAASP